MAISIRSIPTATEKLKTLSAHAQNMTTMNKFFSFSANRLNGQPIKLENYRNQVLLIVNTASHCGFTPQYRELEALYQSYKDKGFSVLGFPCNQFGKQEPGDRDTIANFCLNNYGVSFPLFEKTEVNGNRSHPLFKYLKASAPGMLGTSSIKWNFTKFLIKRDGTVYRRYGPLTPPLAIKGDIECLLEI